MWVRKTNNICADVTSQLCRKCSPVIKYKNPTYFSLFVFCFLSSCFIISCPHLAKFDPIPARQEGIQATLEIQCSSLLSPNCKAFCLFVQILWILCYYWHPHLIYYGLVNNISPLMDEKQRSRFEFSDRWKCAYSRIRLINGSSVWVEAPRVLSGNVYCLETISKSWSSVAFDRGPQKSIIESKIQIHGSTS